MEEELYDTLKNKLLDWIKEEYPHGYEIYASYDDEISDDTICKLIRDNTEKKDKIYDNPLDALYDYLWDNYEDYIGDIEIDLWNEFLKNKNLTESEKEYADENREELWDVFLDNINITIPYDHFLNQRVQCDLVIDNGDWNTEFSRHDCFPNYEAHSNPHSNLSRESGMMLIGNLQGYSNKQIRNIWRQYRLARWYDKENKKKELKEKYPYITSCYHEIWECPSAQTCFVFCINLSLKELLEWHQNPTNITIPKKVTTMGLYNYWSGGGSLLEVQLEKDIVIPKENVAYLLPDEAWTTSQNRGTKYGYSIRECYGMCYDAWTELDSLTTKPQGGQNAHHKNHQESNTNAA